MTRKQDYYKSIQLKSIKDLIKSRKELRFKLFKLRMSNKLQWLTNKSEIWITRKKIAQINTILSTIKKST